MNKLEKQERDSIVKEATDEVYRTTDTQIRKSRVAQCSFSRHNWRRLTDTEIACTNCSTILIIGNGPVEEMFPPEVPEVPEETVITPEEPVTEPPVEEPIL